MHSVLRFYIVLFMYMPMNWIALEGEKERQRVVNFMLYIVDPKNVQWRLTLCLWRLYIF